MTPIPHPRPPYPWELDELSRLLRIEEQRQLTWQELQHRRSLEAVIQAWEQHQQQQGREAA